MVTRLEIGWVLSPVFLRGIFTLPALDLYPILPLKGWQPLHNLNQLKEGAAALSHTGRREIHGAQRNFTDLPERFCAKKTLPPCNPHFPNGSLPREKARGNSSTIKIVCEKQEDSENSVISVPSVALVGRKT